MGKALERWRKKGSLDYEGHRRHRRRDALIGTQKLDLEYIDATIILRRCY